MLFGKLKTEKKELNRSWLDFFLSLSLGVFKPN